MYLVRTRDEAEEEDVEYVFASTNQRHEVDAEQKTKQKYIVASIGHGVGVKGMRVNE